MMKKFALVAAAAMLTTTVGFAAGARPAYAAAKVDCDAVMNEVNSRQACQGGRHRPQHLDLERLSLQAACEGCRQGREQDVAPGHEDWQRTADGADGGSFVRYGSTVARDGSARDGACRGCFSEVGIRASMRREPPRLAMRRALREKPTPA